MVHPYQPIGSPLLVGRAREWEYIAQALMAPRQGQGSLVLLAGEAGVGKSRLAREARRQANSDGFDLLIGHCFEDDSGFAYAPIIDALRSWLAPLPKTELNSVLGVHAAEVVKLLPELAYKIPDIQPVVALDAEAEKRRLIESLYQLFVQSTLPPNSTPLLLIVEDLHWSDESSLDFLYLLARRLYQLPVAVIASYRHEESTPHLRHWLAQVARERLAHKLLLQPLNLDEVGALIRSILKTENPLPVEMVRWIYNLTEGNPFFVEEVLTSLVANGSTSLEARRWTHNQAEEIHIPESLQDVVYRRTAWLSPETQRLLTVAAVSGRRFDFALLQEVTGHSETKLLAMIKELAAAQLVVEESADHFAFRHALTQQAVYRTLLARERRPLHKVIATALELLLESLPSQAAGTQAALLSYHFHAAQEWRKTLVYASQAGERAQALYDPRAALEHWDRALEAADHLSHDLSHDHSHDLSHDLSHDRSLAPTHITLLRGRAWAFEMLGQIEEARKDYEAALLLAHNQEDEEAEWQVLLDLGAMWCAQDYGEAGGYFQQALELARIAGNATMLAHSLNRVGNWFLNQDQPRAALRYHQESLHLFQSTQDRRGQAATLDFLAMASTQIGDIAACARRYEQALSLCQALNERAAMSSIWATLSTLKITSVTESLVEENIPLIEEASIQSTGLEIAREIGARAAESYALYALSLFHGYRGNYALAMDCGRESLAIASAIEHREWMATAHFIIGRNYLDLLEPATARTHALAAVEVAIKSGSTIFHRQTVALLASVYLALDNAQEAEAALATLPGTEQAEFTMAMSQVRLAKVRLHLAVGEPERALQLLDSLLEDSPNAKNAGKAPPTLLLLRAEILLAQGAEAEAEDVLQYAKMRATTQGARPLLWRIWARLATLYTDQRRHGEAAKAKEAARTLIDQLATTIPQQETRERFVERAYLHLPGVTPRKAPRPHVEQGALTAREMEVAMLIAQGCSNREIAAQLTITERTVTTHITHIFEKLDFHTRSQIAVWTSHQDRSKS